MKKSLLFLTVFALSATLYSQTNTWNGSGDGTNWSDAANWSLNAVPTASNDAVIPTGFIVNLNVVGITKSIVAQGNSTLNIYNDLSFTNASSFATNVTVTWSGASLYGGGTLTNNGTVNLTTGGSRYISGGTTFINSGTFNMPGAGYLYLYDTSVFNNAAGGVFDLQSDAVVLNSEANHNFINAGTLKKTGGDGTSYVYCIFTNSGTISVQSGALSMESLSKTFNGGNYNVNSGKVLSLGGQTSVSGTLTGALNGALNWVGNVSVTTTATFNFTGSSQVNWYGGSLIGGGTLTNSSTIKLTSGDSRYISGGTTLINSGTFTMPGAGYLYLYDTSVFNNTASGIFDLQSDAVVLNSEANHNFINAGIFKKTAGSGASYVYCKMTNTGTITVQSGTLSMESLTKTFTGGTYNVSAGKVLSLGGQTNISGTLTGALNGALNWVGNISVATTATFNFTGSTQVNWYGGSLIGGGSLTNIGTITLTSGDSRYITGGTSLNNTGMVTMPEAGYLYLYDTSVFNNAASGTFDLQSDAVLLNSEDNHNFNNVGMFKKTGGTGVAYVYCLMANSGTISVQSGTLSMESLAKTFNGGTYNVNSGNALSLGGLINVSGTLQGLLNGPINWNDNVSVATTASFDFTGTSGVNWYNGSLIGGGTLTNNAPLTLSGGGSKYITGTNTVLENTGTMTFLGNGYLYLYDNTILDNQASGVIDFQSDPVILYSGSGGFNINNAGLIKKTAGTSVTYIYPPVTNSGIIEVMSGELEFVDGYTLTNTVDGVIKGIATIDIPVTANFTNNGTFAPGGTPGTLSVMGDFKSAATSSLDVELFGLVPNTGYDVLAITGNAIFAGNVNVSLNFAPNLNAQFIVATTTGTITQCTLAPTTSTEFDGMIYTFSVLCQNNNQVVLKVTNITLGVDDFEFESSIHLYPNPVRNLLTIKNVNNIELQNAQITDITGKFITSFELKNMGLTKEISLGNLSSGMYFVKINGLNSSVTKRVIKQ